MRFGLLPAAATTAGAGISLGMVCRVLVLCQLRLGNLEGGTHVVASQEFAERQRRRAPAPRHDVRANGSDVNPIEVLPGAFQGPEKAAGHDEAGVAHLQGALPD